MQDRGSEGEVGRQELAQGLHSRQKEGEPPSEDAADGDDATISSGSRRCAYQRKRVLAGDLFTRGATLYGRGVSFDLAGFEFAHDAIDRGFVLG